MSVNNDNFLIEQDDIAFAQSICNDIADDNKRNRAMADVVAAKIAEKYFQEESVDINSGIHNVARVLSDVDISDIYVDGNYIDVRIYCGEDGLEVPKSHYDLDILPVAYMFINLDDDISSGNVVGFVFPEDIDTENAVNGYYSVSEDMLKSFYDVKTRFINIDEEDVDISFEKEVYEYLDGNLSDSQSFYKKLLSSEAARKYLISAAAAMNIFERFDYSSVIAGENAVSAPAEQGLAENDMLSEAGDIADLDIISAAEPLEPLSEGEGIFELAETDSLMNEETDSDELIDGDSLAETEVLSADDGGLLEETSEGGVESLQGDADNNDVLEEFETVVDDVALPEEGPTGDSSSEGGVETNNLPVEDFLSEDEIGQLEIEDEIETSVVDESSAEPDNAILDETLSENEDAEPVAEAVEQNDEFEELSKFDYSTEIMPSISTIEAGEEEESPVTEEMLEISDGKEPDSVPEEETQKEEQLDTLFNEEQQGAVNTTKKKGSPITVLGLVVLLCAAGYFGYTKYFQGMPGVPGSQESSSNIGAPVTESTQEKTQEAAMPIETVENNEIPKSVNEAAPVTIPAIEQNLNASIEVSNLTVNWEVPISYANNTTAKRYFVRVGKILQLNLKTELLTLSSPPITNKITIELAFNKDNGKFSISKIVDSSGVERVDEVIKDTVGRTLGMNLNMNMSVFNSLQGNPVLVIKL